MYNESKATISQWLATEEKGVNKKKIADQLLAYDKSLHDAGLISSAKFRYGIAPSTSRGGGRKGGRAKQATSMAQLQSVIKSTSNTSPKTAITKSASASNPRMRKVAIKKFDPKKKRRTSIA